MGSDPRGDNALLTGLGVMIMEEPEECYEADWHPNEDDYEDARQGRNIVSSPAGVENLAL